MRTVICTMLISLLVAASASAHRLWVNVFESHTHTPPHAMVSLGWGHSLPLDDIMTSVNSRIRIEHFSMLSPSMEKTDFTLPPFALSKPLTATPDIEVFDVDLASRKIALKETAQEGLYQFSAVSKPSFFSTYIDKKGRQRVTHKSLDDIDDIKKVLSAFKYQAFAKSYLAVGPWKQPEPLGHGLEIIPRTDLSNLRRGDLVEVEILFYGKPLNATAKSMDYIAAYSPGFGQTDHFFIGAYVIDGRAGFRVQNTGQWLIGLFHKEDVTPDGPLKDLHGKVSQVYHSASLTFDVK